MTLTELARQLDTSTVTIYRKLKRRGIRVETLRDENTGDLTPAGIQTIAALYDTPGRAVTPDDGDTGHNAQALQDVTGDTERNATPATGDDPLPAAVLAARLEGAEALITQLTCERDALRAQLDAALAALQREQDDRRSERRLLTGGADDDPRPRRRWPWSRR